MSGKPQFDEGAVIDAAQKTFWRHGYAASSVRDLTEATGLSRSSLYQRFRDKDGLFQEALKVYADRVCRRMDAAQADTARGRLEAMLRAFAPNKSMAQRPPGCLIARSCAERAELSDAGYAVTLAAADRQRQIIAGFLRDGVAKGELAPEADVEALAWLYFGVLQAVVNLPHAGADPDVLNRMIDSAMSAWPTAVSTCRGD